MSWYRVFNKEYLLMSLVVTVFFALLDFGGRTMEYIYLSIYFLLLMYLLCYLMIQGFAFIVSRIRFMMKRSAREVRTLFRLQVMYDLQGFPLLVFTMFYNYIILSNLEVLSLSFILKGTLFFFISLFVIILCVVIYRYIAILITIHRISTREE